VEFVKGGKFYWRIFWSPGWVFSGEGMGDLVICNGGRLPTEKLRVRIDLVQKAKDLPEVTLLTGLGLFFWKAGTTGRRLGLVW
jgi:hypothetical protein